MELPQGSKSTLHNQQLFAGLQTDIVSHVLRHGFMTTEYLRHYQPLLLPIEYQIAAMLYMTDIPKYIIIIIIIIIMFYISGNTLICHILLLLN